MVPYMSLGPLTCDKRRDWDLQDGRSRESIRCKYLQWGPGTSGKGLAGHVDQDEK